MSDHVLTFERASHSADAIQRAAYKLSDRLTCDLVTCESTFQCTVHLESRSDEQVEEVLSEFRKEVLDETLRERIRDETREVRNLILALAFSNTGLIESSD